MIFQEKMTKLQRKELLQAASELRRAKSALDAVKKAEDNSKALHGFKKIAATESIVTAKLEVERSFALAQADAEKAYQVVDTYAEKIQATRLRIEAILGR